VASEKRVKFASHANNKTFEPVNALATIKISTLALAGAFAFQTAWAEWNVKGSGRTSF
jgi:hypothetical protein